MIFDAVKAHLPEKSISMRQGMIVNATLLRPATQLNLYEGIARVDRRPENKQGNQWYHRFVEGFAYGMKVHIETTRIQA